VLVTLHLVQRTCEGAELQVYLFPSNLAVLQLHAVQPRLRVEEVVLGLLFAY
jgi:hypothetical protein